GRGVARRSPRPQRRLLRVRPGSPPVGGAPRRPRRRALCAVVAADVPGVARRTTMIASVILPVHNMGSTIDAQLRALAAQQSTVEWELIVVDNASTDDTAARARELCDAHGPPWRVV